MTIDNFKMYAINYDCAYSDFVIIYNGQHAFNVHLDGYEATYDCSYAGKPWEVNLWCSVTENVQEVDVNRHRDLIDHVNWEVHAAMKDSFSYNQEW